jgi:lysozyme family protein
MSEFEPAMDVLIRHEVYAYGTPKQISWSDIKEDKGGETNWGWSMVNIKRMGLTPKDCGLDQDTFTKGCLKNMPESAARALYKRFYWDPYKYKEVADQNIATKLFDFAVNANPRQAVLLVQRALFDLGVISKKDIDGIWGAKTTAAINSAPPVALITEIAEQQKAYYLGLIVKDPSQAKFRAGWLKRAAWVG